MKTKLIAAALALGTSFGANAADIDLTGLGYVQYGDALSYSMPIANYQFGFNTNTGPYAIDSTPGQINDLTVLGTGSDGQPIVTNFDGMDNAYATPSGVSGETFFYPNLVTYQGTEGSVNTNLDTTWDTSLAALQTFLNGEQMVVFFNNNQTNSTDTSDQSLAAWARVWITDASGNVVPGSTFELTNMDGSYNLVSEGGGGVFLGDPTTYTAPGSGPGEPSSFDLNGATDFVLSGGQLCVLTGPGLSVPVPVPCDTVPPPGFTLSAPINHNLGADHVAYAVIFPELNALLETLFASGTDLTDWTLHADIRLGCEALAVDPASGSEPPPGYDYGTTPLANWMECGIANGWGDALNNGYEQIFIGTAIVPRAPEPGSLALVALGLITLGAIARRRRGQK